MRARTPVQAGGRVDAKASAGWRPAGGVDRSDPCVILEKDLAALGDVQALLGALNDAYAGGPKVERLVGKVPVLAARCVRSARKRLGPKEDCSLSRALGTIGNLGLESELLQLLEDLTILRSDLDAARTPK